MKHLTTKELKPGSTGPEVLTDAELKLVKGGDQENVEVGDDEEA